jgi:DNA-binding CsgD family transcriptional regulator
MMDYLQKLKRLQNIQNNRGAINPDKVDLYKEPSVESDPLENFQHYGLTPREIELLSCLAQGKSNPEIGIILNIHPRTVSAHLDHIYTKLGVNSRIGAVVWFLGIMHQAPKSQRREVYTEVGGWPFG